MRIKYQLLLITGIIFLYSCNTRTEQQPEKPGKKIVKRVKPANDITFHFEKSKAWLKQTNNEAAMRIVLAVNRTDSNHLRNMDSILIPNTLTEDLAFYMPFPLQLTAAVNINKILLFSYPSQSFAAYENGELIYTGPTNMGRKKDPTPTGLYFTNWKAEKTTSTFDDEWELKWNFNIENKEGIGFHQYDLPGYPASHSCLRLQDTDARYLYSWADQWVLDHDTVKVKGTPVVVFGSYNFDGPKPWLQLAVNAHALDISEDALAQLLTPYMKEMEEAQAKRK